MNRYLRIIILLLSMSLQASAQIDTTHVEMLPKLSAEYYNYETFLKKNFDYELINKKRALKRNSNDLLIFGVALATGGYLATSYIGEKNGWSMAVSIPVGVVVGAGFLTPFVVWSDHLRTKANNIRVETAYILSLGKHTELGTAFFSSNHNWENGAIGVGLKTTF